MAHDIHEIEVFVSPDLGLLLKVQEGAKATSIDVFVRNLSPSAVGKRILGPKTFPIDEKRREIKFSLLDDLPMTKELASAGPKTVFVIGKNGSITDEIDLNIELTQKAAEQLIVRRRIEELDAAHRAASIRAAAPVPSNGSVSAAPTPIFQKLPEPKPMPLALAEFSTILKEIVHMETGGARPAAASNPPSVTATNGAIQAPEVTQSQKIKRTITVRILSVIATTERAITALMKKPKGSPPPTPSGKDEGGSSGAQAADPVPPAASAVAPALASAPAGKPEEQAHPAAASKGLVSVGEAMEKADGQKPPTSPPPPTAKASGDEPLIRDLKILEDGYSFIVSPPADEALIGVDNLSTGDTVYLFRISRYPSLTKPESIKLPFENGRWVKRSRVSTNDRLRLRAIPIVKRNKKAQATADFKLKAEQIERIWGPLPAPAPAKPAPQAPKPEEAPKEPGVIASAHATAARPRPKRTAQSVELEELIQGLASHENMLDLTKATAKRFEVVDKNVAFVDKKVEGVKQEVGELRSEVRTGFSKLEKTTAASHDLPIHKTWWEKWGGSLVLGLMVIALVAIFLGYLHANQHLPYNPNIGTAAPAIPTTTVPPTAHAAGGTGQSVPTEEPKPTWWRKSSCQDESAKLGCPSSLEESKGMEQAKLAPCQPISSVVNNTYNYYYGSSEGQARKAETCAQLIQPVQERVVVVEQPWQGDYYYGRSAFAFYPPVLTFGFGHGRCWHGGGRDIELRERRGHAPEQRERFNAHQQNGRGEVRIARGRGRH